MTKEDVTKEESPNQISTSSGGDLALENWLLYLMDDIQYKKSFLNETNTLLTTLVDICKKLWLKSDKEDTNMYIRGLGACYYYSNL